MVEYAQAGLIIGDGARPCVVQRVEDCHNGHGLYVIDGAAPQHLITKDEAAGTVCAEKLACQQEMDR